MRTVWLATALMFAISARRLESAAAQFDYYMLTLSWAPDFCAARGGGKDARECGTGRRTGFVVHGLWPQNNTGRGPEHCAPARPVARSIVNVMLNYIPTPGLIQHEWSSHGACTGLNAADYFALVRKARDSVRIPPAFEKFTQPLEESAADIEGQFAAANASFPKAAFRATCTGGTLQEARICFDKNLKPQACTVSAGECRAATMKVLPPR